MAKDSTDMRFIGAIALTVSATPSAEINGKEVPMRHIVLDARVPADLGDLMVEGVKALLEELRDFVQTKTGGNLVIDGASNDPNVLAVGENASEYFGLPSAALMAKDGGKKAN